MTGRINLTLALGIVAITLRVTAVGAQERVVTLDEAIKLAAQVQPTVVQAQANVQRAHAQMRAAKGAYLPTLNFGATGTESYTGGGNVVDPTSGQIVPGSVSNASVGTTLSASVDLFTGFRRRAETRAARATTDAAQAGIVDARYQQRLTTTNQFYDARAAAELVRVRESSVQLATEQLRTSITKLQAGTATRSDTLRSRVALGTAQLNLVTAQSSLATTEAGLGRLVGVFGRVKAADDSSLHQTGPIDTTGLRAEARKGAPVLLNATATAQAARASVAAAHAAYWPTLALGASTGFAGTQRQDYTLNNSSQLRLQLSWNLFDGFSREQQIVQQETNAEVADATALDVGRQVDASVTSGLANLDAATTQVTITGTSLIAAQEDLRVLQERYRVGLATILDVLTSQESLTQAEVDVLTARFAYLRAKATLEAIVAHPL